MKKTLLTKLNEGIIALNLNIAEANQLRLLSFVDLIIKWNRSFNLTAITEPQKMLTHHLLDSLSIASYLPANRIIDVGSGAGLPGIPLAIAFPEKQFFLLDKSSKKARFLQQVKSVLNINNLEIINSRVENFHTTLCFDAIIFRAVGKALDLVKASQHLCCENGQFLLMKGKDPQSECQNLTRKYRIKSIHVPGLNAKRHLVIIENQLKQA